MEHSFDRDSAPFFCVSFLFFLYFSPGLVLNKTGAKTGQRHLTRKHAVQFGLNSYIFTYILKILEDTLRSIGTPAETLTPLGTNQIC